MRSAGRIWDAGLHVPGIYPSKTMPLARLVKTDGFPLVLLLDCVDQTTCVSLRK